MGRCGMRRRSAELTIGRLFRGKLELREQERRNQRGWARSRAARGRVRLEAVESQPSDEPCRWGEVRHRLGNGLSLTIQVRRSHYRWGSRRRRRLRSCLLRRRCVLVRRRRRLLWRRRCSCGTRCRSGRRRCRPWRTSRGRAPESNAWDLRRNPDHCARGKPGLEGGLREIPTGQLTVLRAFASPARHPSVPSRWDDRAPRGGRRTPSEFPRLPTATCRPAPLPLPDAGGCYRRRGAAKNLATVAKRRLKARDRMHGLTGWKCAVQLVLLRKRRVRSRTVRACDTAR